MPGWQIFIKFSHTGAGDGSSGSAWVPVTQFLPHVTLGKRQLSVRLVLLFDTGRWWWYPYFCTHGIHCVSVKIKQFNSPTFISECFVLFEWPTYDQLPFCPDQQILRFFREFDDNTSFSIKGWRSSVWDSVPGKMPLVCSSGSAKPLSNVLYICSCYRSGSLFNNDWDGVL